MLYFYLNISKDYANTNIHLLFLKRRTNHSIYRRITSHDNVSLFSQIYQNLNIIYLINLDELVLTYYDGYANTDVWFMYFINVLFL